jgi:peptide/nickel transport system permease protein
MIYRASLWRRFRRHKLAIVGSVLSLVLLLSAVLAPWMVTHSFSEVDLKSLFQPPSRTHLLGTDELGHDVFARIVFAARVSLTVGMIATIVSNAAGTSIGLLAGFYGGLLDNLLMRFTDVFVSLPVLAVMFVLAKFVGPGLWNIAFVLCCFGWMSTARLVRGEVIKLRTQEFIEAARAMGVPDRRLITRHLLPNVMAPVVVGASLFVGQAIVNESTISYFGLGIQPPLPSWGNMLQNSQQFLWTAPWLALYPGVCIFVTVLAFNFLGDGLRDALDPRL